jgi:ferric-dicitrate binding protein FerR (iron transport regulator)
MKQQKSDMEQHFSGWKVPASRTKEEAWESLRDKIAAGTKSSGPKKPAGKKYSLVLWAGAAAAVFLLALTAGPKLGLFSHPVKNNGQTVRTVWLPDSSRVNLKARSEINYSYFGKREVKLKGEAFFQVKAGKKFRVKFPGGSLTVLGTSFNILAYGESSGRIDCFSGTVSIEIHGKETTLKANQSVLFDSSSTEGPFTFNPQEILSLPAGTYRWSDRPLREVLTLLCERQGLRLEAPQTILNRRFSGSLDIDKTSQALQILSTAMQFNWKIENGKLLILEKE